MVVEPIVPIPPTPISLILMVPNRFVRVMGSAEAAETNESKLKINAKIVTLLILIFNSPYIFIAANPLHV
jgi:hypothetical protein